MTNIVRRCIAWNEARYDRVYDYPLAGKLLIEETLELFSAKDDIEKLDAVADIVFVSIGVLWKLGVDVEDIEDIFGTNNNYLASGIDIEKVNQVCDNITAFLFDAIDEKVPAAYPGIALTVYSSFVVALGTLHGMGMTKSFYDIVMAVCDSNDTKEIKGKVDPTVKANVVKGQGFVPPTKRLEEIYAQHHAGLKSAQN